MILMDVPSRTLPELTYFCNILTLLDQVKLKKMTFPAGIVFAKSFELINMTIFINVVFLGQGGARQGKGSAGAGAEAGAGAGAGQGSGRC